MKSLIQIIKENVSNFYLIIRLSLFELKSSNNSHYLGMFWEILNPMILVGIYWFVFGYGIRGGKDVGGIEFLPWMLCGIVVWFFMSQAIPQGSKSVYSRIKIISKMNFPLSVIPTFVITSKLYFHVVLVGIIIVILSIYGYTPTIYFLQFPYFLAGNFLLMISISLITSTLSTIIRDVQMLVQAAVRVLMYVTPILWSNENMSMHVKTLMKINPIYYIVEGYRSALLGTNWYIVDNQYYTLYFWGVVLVLLLLGSTLQVKFKERFVDYL
ncbi:teichoic acid transport system permease protein [Neobacillus bataviensis]|uniref:Transport permease protein n=1 Tax=Neobacillus bataviensis TaxID=220685 RepID=A0A561CN59_9BACI|nr:ABC transporter permease [Neobacillus bataviensis]TWD92402.1 teichoic acid transport system permease protein [Neobacillus bataviensis]